MNSVGIGNLHRSKENVDRRRFGKDCCGPKTCTTDIEPPITSAVATPGGGRIRLARAYVDVAAYKFYLSLLHTSRKCNP